MLLQTKCYIIIFAVRNYLNYSGQSDMHMKIHLEFLLFVCQTNNSTFLFKTAHFIWRMGKNVACVIYVCCNQCWARDNYWASWVPIKQDNNVSTCVRAPKTCKKRKIFSLTGVKTELPQHNWTHQSTILLTLKHCHVVARVAASAQLRYKFICKSCNNNFKNFFVPTQF